MLIVYALGVCDDFLGLDRSLSSFTCLYIRNFFFFLLLANTQNDLLLKVTLYKIMRFTVDNKRFLCHFPSSYQTSSKNNPSFEPVSRDVVLLNNFIRL